MTRIRRRKLSNFQFCHKIVELPRSHRLFVDALARIEGSPRKICANAWMEEGVGNGEVAAYADSVLTCDRSGNCRNCAEWFTHQDRRGAPAALPPPSLSFAQTHTCTSFATRGEHSRRESAREHLRGISETIVDNSRHLTRGQRLTWESA